MALADLKRVERNEAAIGSVLGILKQRFGEQFVSGKSVCEQHGHTTTYIPNQAPDGVVFIRKSEDVKQVVEICAEHRVPIIPFGVGTSLEGHVNAPGGGISVDFSQMNQIIKVNQEDLDVHVEPGVTRKQLNDYLRDSGLFFPIDPGADASIGGMSATRASGTNAVRYGTMRENVISLTAVMADGREICTASRARKSSAGYDLTRLLVGSEGTLGIITSVHLKLHGIPQAIAGGVCSFPTLDAAANAVIMTIQMGIPVARIEILNSLSIQSLNQYSNLDYPVSPCLFLEFHGSDESVREQSKMFDDIAKDLGGGPFAWTDKAEERNKLWQARHDAYWAGVALRPGCQGISTDVCVPISRFADCIGETERDIKDSGLIAPIIGHAGDGNFHALVLMDKNDKGELTRCEEFVARLNMRAIEMEGTCTGEHGIGQGKMPYLRHELGDSVDFMQMVKRSFDPLDILNPGKIFAD